MSSNTPRMSQVLDGIAGSGNSPRITVGEIMQALGARAFSLLIVVMGLPNSLPMPPPIALALRAMQIDAALADEVIDAQDLVDGLYRPSRESLQAC